MTNFKYLSLVLASSVLLGCASSASRQPAPVYEAGAAVNGSNRAAVNNTTRRNPAPIQDRSQVVNDPQRNSWNTQNNNTVPRTHQVQRGETLYGVARMYNVDRQDLADLNDMPSNAPLTIGQTLVLPANDTQPNNVVTRPDVVVSGARTVPLKTQPAAVKNSYNAATGAVVRKAATVPSGKTAVDPADESLQWIVPAEGQIVGGFSETGPQKGLEFFGEFGSPVLASAGGEVVYSGTGLRGYGKLILIKHNGTYITAYAHNSRLLVKQGQMVTGGEKIAEMGNTDTNRVKLYFEIRRFGKPVDPSKYLRLN
ncbi:MAG: peptidoglycan DD-metalloendopeptidase family protein [Gallionella sp.]|nr:peptidoglycan DD-metalloendopeptidase family protein [Gallionella sp.]MDD4958929.1 peptidoglycan DD-metalloendopeptidase family protein [Gallionella sp.]